VVEWPDPTEGEARALILGLATFWGCWAFAALGLVQESSLMVPPFVGGFAAGIWFYWSGLLHVMARTSGRTVASLYFGGFRRAWRARRDATFRSTWRLFMPAYFRRAATVLRWNPQRVLAGLGGLLGIDLVMLVWMMSRIPSQ
jgi:hypothetical protein